jgi:hypothetical protein
MTDEWKKNVILSLGVALLTTLAAVGGAWVTGQHMIDAQRLQNEQAVMKITSENAQNELKEIRAKASKYFRLIQNIMIAITKEDIPKIELDNQMMLIGNEGYDILFLSPSTLGVRTLNLNAKIIKLRNGIDTDEYDKLEGEFQEALGAWFTAYIDEIEKYHTHTLPNIDDSAITGAFMDAIFER